MGKLPKEMRQKKARSKDLRSRGNPNAQQAAGSKGINRQMRRKMQQQGVDNMDTIEAKRVIIQTDDEDLIINEPQIIKLNQQGMEIYQVIGEAVAQASGSYDEILSDAENGLNSDDDMIYDDADVVSTEMTAEITEQDIQLVAMQTGVSEKVAEAALKEVNGDLARAIINLKEKSS